MLLVKQLESICVADDVGLSNEVKYWFCENNCKLKVHKSRSLSEALKTNCTSTDVVDQTLTGMKHKLDYTVKGCKWTFIQGSYVPLENIETDQM